MDLEQLTHLILLSGIAACLVLTAYYGLAKVKSLFWGFRKLKTERALAKMTERSRVARFLYNWWNRPQRSEHKDKLVVEFLAACDQGRLDDVRHLMDRGVGVNGRRARGGKTGLIRAAQNGHLEVVRYLLKRGADVNATGGRSGKTALMRAVEKGDLGLVQLLLRVGADMNAKNRYGETAIDIAFKSGWEALGELLKAYGANFFEYANQGPSNHQIGEIEKYYAILKCKKTDSMEEVKAQYRKLIKQYHPDVIQGKGLPADFVQFADEKFRMIQQAYQHIAKKQGERR